MPYHRPIPESQSQKKYSSGFDSLVKAEKLLQIAFVLPSATLIGWAMGAWADSHFHQRWIAIVGLLFGSISGLVYVVRMAMDAEKSTPDEAAEDPGKTEKKP
jgi:F0F1-type ATP synthase assembly protein I